MRLLEKYSDFSGAILLFIVWPIFALVNAFINYRQSWAKNILWIFVIFYGFTFVISTDGMDANRYRDEFIEMAHSETSPQILVNQFYQTGTNNVDIVKPLVNYLVSRFTDNVRIFFAVLGFIFGYFYSRNIWYLLDKAGSKLNIYSIPIIITFAIVVGFWQINGFRFWTATHVFLFGTLSYLVEGKKKFLWVTASSALFHFAYMLPVGVLFVYIFAGNRIHLYFTFFVITLFISEVNFHFIQHLLSYLPDIFYNRTLSYARVDYAEKIWQAKANMNWYAQIYGRVLKYAVAVLTVLIYWRGKEYLRKKEGLYRLFCFSILLFGVANLTSLVPSGGRFLALSNLFMLALIFWYLQMQNTDKWVQRIIPVIIPALVLFIIVSIRIAFDTIGLVTVLGNPLIAPFLENKTALINLIK